LSERLAVVHITVQRLFPLVDDFIYRAYDVQYLDDGKTEKNVPLDELRLFSEHDRDGAPPKLPPSSMVLPLSGLLQQGSGSDEGETIVKTPRAVVHTTSLKDGGDSKHGDENVDSGVFVVEGQQDRLAGGGGLRGIRFLKNSTRA